MVKFIYKVIFKYKTMSPIPETLEAANAERSRVADNAEKLQSQERLKAEFNNHPEVKLTANALDTLVNPEQKDILLGRLLLKFEKDSNNFDFAQSLHKVLYWEDIGGMRSSGINLENKNDIYNELMKVSAEGLGMQEDSIKATTSSEALTPNKEAMPTINIDDIDISEPMEKMNTFMEDLKNMSPEERGQFMKEASDKAMQDINKDIAWLTPEEIIGQITWEYPVTLSEESLNRVTSTLKTYMEDNHLSAKELQDISEDIVSTEEFRDYESNYVVEMINSKIEGLEYNEIQDVLWEMFTWYEKLWLKIPEEQKQEWNKFVDILMPALEDGNLSKEEFLSLVEEFEDQDSETVLAELDNTDTPEKTDNKIVDQWEKITEQKDDIEIVSRENKHCKFWPTIDNCTKPGGLTPEEWQEAKKALSGLEEWANIKQALDTTNISPEHTTQLTKVVEYMIDPEVQNQNRENFNKDFWERVEELEHLKIENWEWEKVFNDMAQQAIERLWKNYFVNLDTNGDSLNSTQALNTAFETCIEEIWEKVNNVDESSVDYKKITYDIQDTDKSFTERMEALVKLEDLTNAETAKAGTQDKKTKKKLKNDTEESEAKKEKITENDKIDRKEKADTYDKNSKILEESEVLNISEKKSSWDVFSTNIKFEAAQDSIPA